MDRERPATISTTPENGSIFFENALLLYSGDISSFFQYLSVPKQIKELLLPCITRSPERLVNFGTGSFMSFELDKLIILLN